MQSVGKQGFFKHSPEGETPAWVLLEGRAKWNRLAWNRPPRTQRWSESSYTKSLGGAGRGSPHEHVDCKDRTKQFTLCHFQPLELEREILLSTQRTKGGGPGGLGSGWGGVAGSQNPPSSCSAIYIRPALSWTGQTPAGPQRSKPGHMFLWGKHTQTSKHQAQGGLTHSWDIAKTYSGGTLHCSLLPLTRQPTHGNKATWAPPHGPLGPSPRTPGLSRTQPRAHGLRNALPSTAI